MTVQLSVDRSRWLELPKSFPTPAGDSPKEWEDRVIHGMHGAWKEAMDGPAEEAVRTALRFGLSRIRPEDAVTLQFWPTTSIINAVVHVVASVADSADLADPVPLSPGVYATQPIVDPFLSDSLGPGVETRYLRAFESSGAVLGGLAYFFPGTNGFVYVGLEDTLPRVAGVTLEPLRELVRGIRWNDEEGARWQAAGLDPAIFTTDESWTFDDAPATAQG